MSLYLSLAISLVGFLIVVIGSAILLILRDAMNKEAAAVIPERTRNLIERAKNRLPEEARPRWEEEWPAGFAEAIEKRPVWALREAISLYRGAGKIAAELEPAAAAAGRQRQSSLPRSRPSRVPRGSNRLRLQKYLLSRMKMNMFGTVNRLIVLILAAVNHAIQSIRRVAVYAVEAVAPRGPALTLFNSRNVFRLIFLALGLATAVKFQVLGL